MQQVIKPSYEYPYEPRTHTPKFVNIKKINDAETAPINLKNILFLKNFVTKPIIKTLPHVKKNNFMKTNKDICNQKTKH